MPYWSCFHTGWTGWSIYKKFDVQEIRKLEIHQLNDREEEHWEVPVDMIPLNDDIK